MNKILISIVITLCGPAVILAEAAVPQTLAECRKSADEILSAALKACKANPETERKACAKAALEKNSSAIQACGSTQIKNQPKDIPLPPT